jgi:hypothetical protein
MAILHKNISAEGDIHNPKWFSGANNGDVAWRNELGVLESTDELVLPAALDFVDGSAAPPTSNSGDIYVLSSGASVNAGWGTVALGDWVRYDGTTWNDVTPQKSTLCYNENTDALNSYDGVNWNAPGGGIASVTSAEKAALSPSVGEFVYDTDLSSLQRYNGSNWISVANGYGLVSVNDSNGVPTYYTTIESAFSSISGDGVINIHQDVISISELSVTGINKNLIINGNGYTITHTSNTGSEFNFIDIGSSTNKIYLNDISVISNGTGTSSNSSVFINSGEVINNNTTSIQSNVNNIAESCSVTGGKLICNNAIANFTGKLTNLTLETYQTRGSLIGCDITLINNGSILNGNLLELMNCNITGNSTSGTMVNLSSFTKCYNNRILCTTGSNNAVIIDSGSLNGFPCFEKCTLIQQGTGQAITYSGARPIVNSYIYASSSVCVRGTGVGNTQSSYNLENVICENNASSKPVLEMTSGFGVSVRNSTFTSLNSSNTKATIELLLVSSFKARIIDCKVNNSNNSVNNIKFDGSPSTGGAFIYGLTMSEKGNGVAYNSVSLLNTNTVDSYGNVQIG